MAREARRDLLGERRSTHDLTHVKEEYPPPPSVVKDTLCTREQYEKWYRQSLDDPESFWSSIAKELYFQKSWEQPFMRCGLARALPLLSQASNSVIAGIPTVL
jgi:Acetyl-coenzyme A synthetase N-terminus